MKKISLLNVIGSGIISIFTAIYPAIAENWIYMGDASTGEKIYIDADSISSGREGVRFIYKIGNETLQAAANCDANTWYVLEYEQTYSPQSDATQSMINYVCGGDNTM